MSRRVGELGSEEALTEKEKEYAKLRLQGNAPSKSFQLAYKPNQEADEELDALNGKTIEKREFVQAYIQRKKEILSKKIVDEADPAFERIKALAVFGDSERVRLDANSGIMKMAGMLEQKISFSDFNIFNISTPEQIGQEIRKAIQESAEKQQSLDVEFLEVL